MTRITSQRRSSERMCGIEMPFGWDDTKSTKTLGAVIMQLFNKGKSTKLHRNSTITAAITNIRNMKDTATKTVILHVGSNDMDNNKHKQETTPRPYVQQPNMASPWGGPKRHNFAPVRGWSPPGPAPPTRSSYVPARGGPRGQHAKSNPNTVPLGPRIPSRQTSTANPTAGNQVSSSLHVVKPAVLTTIQQGTLKHLKLPWKQQDVRYRRLAAAIYAVFGSPESADRSEYFKDESPWVIRPRIPEDPLQLADGAVERQAAVYRVDVVDLATTTWPRCRCEAAPAPGPARRRRTGQPASTPYSMLVFLSPWSLYDPHEQSSTTVMSQSSTASTSSNAGGNTPPELVRRRGTMTPERKSFLTEVRAALDRYGVEDAGHRHLHKAVDMVLKTFPHLPFGRVREEVKTVLKNRRDNLHRDTKNPPKRNVWDDTVTWAEDLAPMSVGMLKALLPKREKLRVDGRLTNCETGDRFCYMQEPATPADHIPRNVELLFSHDHGEIDEDANLLVIMPRLDMDTALYNNLFKEVSFMDYSEAFLSSQHNRTQGAMEKSQQEIQRVRLNGKCNSTGVCATIRRDIA
ncbi:hypothetical protein Bbelb_048640 [Branchiostoma belcheri]|nr:hypothetical protein Bbelb_048640 [Branchiostoma belcheri]